MTLVLIEKGLVLGGWPPKIEVIGVPGIYVYIYIILPIGWLYATYHLLRWNLKNLLIIWHQPPTSTLWRRRTPSSLTKSLQNAPSLWHQQADLKSPPKKGKPFLVGGWTTHLNNMCLSKWKSSPNTGENNKYLKPPPRFWNEGIFLSEKHSASHCVL